MAKKNSSPQLRRCTKCDKVGHNRSRCPELNRRNEPAPSIPKKPDNQPSTSRPNFRPQPSSGTRLNGLQLFVHHVNSLPQESRHFVDLKKANKNNWDHIETIAPSNASSLFQSYHRSTSSHHHISESVHTPISLPSKKNAKKTLSFQPTIATKKSKPLSARIGNFFNKFTASKKDALAFSEGKNITITEATSEKHNPQTEFIPVNHTHAFDNYADVSGILEPLEKEEEMIVTPVIEKMPIIAKATAAKSTSSQSKKSSFSINKLALQIEDTFHIAQKNSKRILRRAASPRYAIIALIGVLIITLPGPAKTYYSSLQSTKNKVVENGTAGFMALQDSAASLMSANMFAAATSTNQALANFNTAISVLENEHHIIQNIASVVPVLGSEVKSRQNLLLAGQQMALGNSYLLEGFAAASTNEKNTTTTLTQRLDLVTRSLDAALPKYHQALDNLNTVKPSSLPVDMQQTFQEFTGLFQIFVHDLESLNDLSKSMKEIFGGNGFRRYLLIFQNPHEIRATGGFMGSFAILEMKDGAIQKLEVPPGGAYDLQGQLDEYLEPPTPLLLTNARWEFQDANYFPDFPTSAEKILWFYRHSRGVTADGVIAINSTVLERLLGIMGPIMNTERGLTLTKDNAVPLLQQLIEKGPEKKTNTPKAILGELAPQFVDYLKNLQIKDLMPVLTNLNEALSYKEIQAYFTDPTTESLIRSFGWGGQILPTIDNQDYLTVVNTNIQGQKSDAKIAQSITHQAVIADDGTITDTVIISRVHSGAKDTEFYGAPNIDYLRVYVPEGSTLISATGFSKPSDNNARVPKNWSKQDELLAQIAATAHIDPLSNTLITSESGKTSFGNWLVTEPGETSTAVLTYQLPFHFSSESNKTSSFKQWQKIFYTTQSVARYQLIAQTQSGVKSTFESQIILPKNWKMVWQNGKNIELAANGITITSSAFNTDSIWSLAATKL